MDKSIYAYDTVIIFKLKDDDALMTRTECITKFTNLFQEFSKPKKIKVDEIGEKSLAYEIAKYKSGYYVTIRWQGTYENVKQSEAEMRKCDYVLKFITVKQDAWEDFELEGMEEESLILPTQDKSEQKPDALDVLLGLADYK